MDRVFCLLEMASFEKKTVTFSCHSRLLSHYLRWPLNGQYPGDKLTPSLHLQLRMLFTCNHTTERESLNVTEKTNNNSLRCKL